jgi:hypothetical protein
MACGSALRFIPRPRAKRLCEVINPPEVPFAYVLVLPRLPRAPSVLCPPPHRLRGRGPGVRASHGPALYACAPGRPPLAERGGRGAGAGGRPWPRTRLPRSPCAKPNRLDRRPGARRGHAPPCPPPGRPGRARAIPPSERHGDRLSLPTRTLRRPLFGVRVRPASHRPLARRRCRAPSRASPRGPRRTHHDGRPGIPNRALVGAARPTLPRAPGRQSARADTAAPPQGRAQNFAFRNRVPIGIPLPSHGNPSSPTRVLKLNFKPDS